MERELRRELVENCFSDRAKIILCNVYSSSTELSANVVYFLETLLLELHSAPSVPECLGTQWGITCMRCIISSAFIFRAVSHWPYCKTNSRKPTMWSWVTFPNCTMMWWENGVNCTFKSYETNRNWKWERNWNNKPQQPAKHAGNLQPLLNLPSLRT